MLSEMNMLCKCGDELLTSAARACGACINCAQDQLAVANTVLIKLPLTKDGARMVPFADWVWSPRFVNAEGQWFSCEVCGWNPFTNEWYAWSLMDGWPVSECFSSEQAGRAAESTRPTAENAINTRRNPTYTRSPISKIFEAEAAASVNPHFHRA